MPAPGPQGIAFVNALARSPSPNFRDRIPASFSFSEAPRPREVPCGRTAVDPRAKRPVACAAWAHNFPIQGGKRMIGKMDSVEEETGTESALGTPALTHRVPQPRVVPTIPATNRPTYGLDGQANSGSVPQQELPASPASPNHSPLSPTRIVRSKPIEVKPVEATVATAEERFSSNPQDGHMSLESALQEIQKLRQQNQQLLKEAESQCQPKNDDSGLVAKNAQLERDARDMLQQFEEFEREKEDEVKEFQEEIAQLNAKLAEKDVAMKRYKSEVERERENLLQAMTDESSELQGRVAKLEKDKETLQVDLAKALARVDVLTAGQAASSQVDEAQLRPLQTECEALKDEVTNKDGQIILLRSQLEIADRKLRLSDMENAMLKSEMELRKRSSSSQSATL